MSGMRATSPMKADLARQIRATAGKVDGTHPETVAGQHLRKAATLVQSGQHDGAKRHLDAAMELMTPRNLIRHGITDDEGHATAKQAMHQINVHRLGVQDVQDTEARNTQQAEHKRDTIAQVLAAKQAKAQQAAAVKQQQIEQRTAAKPTGTGPGSQQQTGPQPDPILAAANPAAGGILLSARTAMLERTAAPYGKPGGPGLYGKQGNKHSDYFEQIVQALMSKRGMSKEQASAIAWSRLRKWSAGGGGVHPEVRAAAARALGQEQAAKLSAGSWEQAARLIELVTATTAASVELAGFNPAQPRVPAGSAGGGQFGGQGAAAAQQGGKGSRAQRRAKLVKQAVKLRGEIAALLLQIHAASHHHHSKSSTPRKKGAAATSAKAAAASKAAAAKAKAAKTSTKTAAKTMTLAQMKTRLAALRQQLHAVMQQIHHLADEDRAAIELAGGYSKAWQHELRGPHGQFVSGAGGPRTSRGAARRAMVASSSGGAIRPPAPRSLRAQAGARGMGSGLRAGERQTAREIHALADELKRRTTAVQESAAQDAEQRARAAAQATHQHLMQVEHNLDKIEAKKHKQKLVIHVMALAAGAILTYLAAKLGSPELLTANLAPGALTIQELIDWRRRL